MIDALESPGVPDRSPDCEFSITAWELHQACVGVLDQAYFIYGQAERKTKRNRLDLWLKAEKTNDGLDVKVWFKNGRADDQGT